MYETLGDRYREGMKLVINYVRKKHLNDYLWEKDIYPDGRSLKRRSDGSPKNGEDLSGSKRSRMVHNHSGFFLNEDLNTDSNDASNISNCSLNSSGVAFSPLNCSVPLATNGGSSGGGDSIQHSPIVRTLCSFSTIEF